VIETRRVWDRFQLDAAFSAAMRLSICPAMMERCCNSRHPSPRLRRVHDVRREAVLVH
jgi:hypothetical protein